MSVTTCQRCGAAVRGLVCEYCGVLHHPPASATEEKQAWVEFLGILQTKEPEVQVSLLQNGFLPDSLPTLLDAGLHCVGLIDMSNTADDLVQAAQQRLQAITAKLKIMPANPESERAIAEFESTLAAYRRADRQMNQFLLWGCAGTLVLCVVLSAGAAFWLN
ncbi:MAG: hypothetical protein KDD89_09350 [Anaerolineales bacterium]|nr:hypothetical protein [Anaerolineales bacterium]